MISVLVGMRWVGLRARGNSAARVEHASANGVRCCSRALVVGRRSRPRKRGNAHAAHRPTHRPCTSLPPPPAPPPAVSPPAQGGTLVRSRSHTSAAVVFCRARCRRTTAVTSRPATVRRKSETMSWSRDDPRSVRGGRGERASASGGSGQWACAARRARRDKGGRGQTEAEGLDVAALLARARVEVAVADLGARADRQLLVAGGRPAPRGSDARNSSADCGREGQGGRRGRERERGRTCRTASCTRGTGGRRPKESRAGSSSSCRSRCLWAGSGEGIIRGGAGRGKSGSARLRCWRPAGRLWRQRRTVSEHVHLQYVIWERPAAAAKGGGVSVSGGRPQGGSKAEGRRRQGAREQPHLAARRRPGRAGEACELRMARQRPGETRERCSCGSALA